MRGGGCAARRKWRLIAEEEKRTVAREEEVERQRVRNQEERQRAQEEVQRRRLREAFPNLCLHYVGAEAAEAPRPPPWPPPVPPQPPSGLPWCKAAPPARPPCPSAGWPGGDDAALAPRSRSLSQVSAAPLAGPTPHPPAHPPPQCLLLGATEAKGFLAAVSRGGDNNASALQGSWSLSDRLSREGGGAWPPRGPAAGGGEADEDARPAKARRTAAPGSAPPTGAP